MTRCSTPWIGRRLLHNQPARSMTNYNRANPAPGQPLVLDFPATKPGQTTTFPRQNRTLTGQKAAKPPPIHAQMSPFVAFCPYFPGSALRRSSSPGWPRPSGGRGFRFQGANPGGRAQGQMQWADMIRDPANPGGRAQGLLILPSPRGRGAGGEGEPHAHRRRLLLDGTPSP